MFSIVWKLIILYLCESNIEFYMRVKEIPILLLTGYLGSGKTTLVNHILSNKRGIKFAVIVNDIGEVNIDADLIQRGVSTRKGDRLFIHILDLQDDALYIPLKAKVKKAIQFISKTPLSFKQEKNGILIKLPQVPDDIDYVIELVIKQ